MSRLPQIADRWIGWKICFWSYRGGQTEYNDTSTNNRCTRKIWSLMRGRRIRNRPKRSGPRESAQENRPNGFDLYPGDYSCNTAMCFRSRRNIIDIFFWMPIPAWVFFPFGTDNTIYSVSNFSCARGGRRLMQKRRPVSPQTLWCTRGLLQAPGGRRDTRAKRARLGAHLHADGPLHTWASLGRLCVVGGGERCCVEVDLGSARCQRRGFGD